LNEGTATATNGGSRSVKDPRDFRRKRSSPPRKRRYPISTGAIIYSAISMKLALLPYPILNRRLKTLSLLTDIFAGSRLFYFLF
jgi:hypothetical protein